MVQKQIFAGHYPKRFIIITQRYRFFLEKAHRRFHQKTSKTSLNSKNHNATSLLAIFAIDKQIIRRFSFLNFYTGKRIKS